MISKKLFYSWIYSSVAMFSLSYLWHGYILNDLDNVQVPLPLYMGLASIVYLVIGLLIAFLYTSLNLFTNLLTKGISFGVAIGFFLYLVAFMLGVSFKADGVEHIVIDFMWQMIEQGAGGFMIGVVHWHFARKEQLLGHD